MCDTDKGHASGKAAMNAPFRDRQVAGRELGQLLKAYAGREDVVVLALPRGGVPVGYEVAQALGARLDVLIVRKLGLPSHPELAMGAIASGGSIDLNHEVISNHHVSQHDLEVVMARESRELTRREALYRGPRAAEPIQDQIVIVVDDGLATGATMRAALYAVKSRQPAKLVVAVPVAPADLLPTFKNLADEFICVLSPRYFGAVGQFYEQFDQTSDEEVQALLRQSDVAENHS